MNRTCLSRFAASRMRPSDWSTLSRHCVRCVFRCSTFPLAPALGSATSAAGGPALFGGFPATMAGSDFSPPYITGVWLSPSQCGQRPEGRRRRRDLPVSVRRVSTRAWGL